MWNFCHYQREKWPDEETRQAAEGTDKDKINHLSAIGFVWNTTQYKWDKQFNKLVAYKHLHRTTALKSWDRCLYEWCKYQRQDKYPDEETRQAAEGNDKDNINRLNAIGFEW